MSATSTRADELREARYPVPSDRTLRLHRVFDRCEGRVVVTCFASNVYRVQQAWGGYAVVGSAEQVVEQLGVISGAGVDGCLLSWTRYIEDMRRFQQETCPLLVEAGLR